MKISIIGTGYVGLVTAVCLADKGHQVVCVDIDGAKIEQIQNAKPPIYERGLEALLQKHINRNLRATTRLYSAVIDSDVSFITVGTPFDGKRIDLSFVRDAAWQIGTALKDKSTYHVVVVKSTVVPGTTDDVVLPTLENASEKKAGIDFGVGVNPEFLREGEAIQDFMFPDRIVLGGIDEASLGMLEQLYRVFVGADIIKTNNKTAEMIKYTSNALLATLISFSNEIANLGTTIGGVDCVEVMRGVHLDRRLSPLQSNGSRMTPPITSYLAAGCGFGGSCFPKDVKALAAHGEMVGRPMQLLNAVLDVNADQPHQIRTLLHKHFSTLSDVHVAVLGLAFKPGTDDVRESPAIAIIHDLLAERAFIQAYDPVAKREAQRLLTDSRIRFCDTLEQTINGVQAVIVVTSWEEFHRLPTYLANIEPQPLVVDCRRILPKHSVARYAGIGL